MDQNSKPESCPQCHKSGEVRKLIPVYYNRAEAFYTCENKNCVYFVTDRKGNPVKFRFNEESRCLVPVTPAEEENIDTKLEELMLSLQTPAKSTSAISKGNISLFNIVEYSPGLRDQPEFANSVKNYHEYDIDFLLS